MAVEIESIYTHFILLNCVLEFAKHFAQEPSFYLLSTGTQLQRSGR